MDDGAGELQCVGRLEVAKPKPVVGFLCGTLPVLTDAPAFHSALLVPSPLTIGAPRYQMLPAETDLNTLPLPSGIPEKVIPAATGASEESGTVQCLILYEVGKWRKWLSLFTLDWKWV